MTSYNYSGGMARLAISQCDHSLRGFNPPASHPKKLFLSKPQSLDGSFFHQQPQSLSNPLPPVHTQICTVQVTRHKWQIPVIRFVRRNGLTAHETCTCTERKPSPSVFGWSLGWSVGWLVGQVAKRDIEENGINSALV